MNISKFYFILLYCHFQKKMKINNYGNWNILILYIRLDDWDKNLTGYFFPNYNLSSLKNKDDEKAIENLDFDEETKVIDKLNKEKQKILGGNLMLPMIKLYLLDNEEGIDLEFAINSLKENAQRAIKWQEWIKNNHREFNIIGNAICQERTGICYLLF